MASLTVMYDKHPHVPMVITQAHIDKMRACISGELNWCGDEDECLRRGYDTDALFIWGGTKPIPERYIAHSRNLKWIHTFSAGYDPLAQSAAVREKQLIVTNAKGIHGPIMSVTTLGYIISFLRRSPELLRAQQKHAWVRRFESGEPASPVGKVACIVGAGAIGTETARLCKAIGMKTIGVKRSVKPLEHFDEVMSSARLDEALAQADFVVVVTPHTPETYHMIDAGRLACMKPGAVLINIGRGPVVDTDALTEALQKGIIGGAALDAVEPEPLPENHPLWDMPNVILSPHCSAVYAEYIDDAVDQFCDLLRRFEAGEPLYNLVDLKA